MKIIIFSDSHGQDVGMKKVIEAHPEAELVIHLGDGAKEFEALKYKFQSIGFVNVPGNAEDPLAKSPLCTIVIECAGKRLVLTHGHEQDIKTYGVNRLTNVAADKNADAVLFGHTHEPYEEYVVDNVSKPFYLFNPGSISRPYRGRPSYGLLEIKGNDMLFSHGTI